MLFQQQLQTRHASSIGQAASQMVMVVLNLQNPAQHIKEHKLPAMALSETVFHALIH